MALMEGLHAVLGLGIRSVEVVTNYRVLHNHVRDLIPSDPIPLIIHTATIDKWILAWRIKQKKVEDMVSWVLSMERKFDQFELLLVPRHKVDYVINLARNFIDDQITKILASNAIKERRETCTICLEDTDISKFHVTEGCAHRFCFPCMKEHVKVKLLNGMLPDCPQDGCTTKLSVEGSKIFLPPRLIEIMVERIREGQIPPAQKIYCPYPKCSALMSLSELIHPLQECSSKYTAVDAATLRKCVNVEALFASNVGSRGMIG